jgi:hypothetical protein
VLGSVIFYAGALAGLAGAIGVVWPIRRLGLPTRRRGTAVASAGVVLVAAALLLPDPTRTAPGRETLIDRALPEWQFGEFHARRVRATSAQVFRAIREVRASDIWLFRTLTFLRNPGRRVEGEHILNAPDDKPILEVALNGGFVLLGEEADRELVIGTVVAAPPDIGRAARERRARPLDAPLFLTLDSPGFARAVMNFRATPEADGWTLVTTETRVHAIDRATQRRFAAYWRAIYPGSAIIRWSWLRAIEARIAS